MDSVTHIVLGACIGEALAGRQLGKKALLIGAIANSLPDIDFVASFWMPVTGDLLAHRGLTHSFFFLAIIAPLLGALCHKLFSSPGMSLWRWIVFWAIQLFVHIFLDAFNCYGTGWFEPFSHYRVAFNSMFVADPLFTIWPLMASIVLLLRSSAAPRRKRWALVAISMSTLYLASGITNKLFVDTKVHHDLSERHIEVSHYFSTPTPLNNLLWYVVAESDSGFYIGYRSVLDPKGNTSFRYACRNKGLLNNAKDQQEIHDLIRFSQGFYTVNMLHDTLVFNDLRFGEILGWADTLPRCVFYYNVDHPRTNEMIVQRGRFARWDMAAVMAFIRRIRGSR